MSKNHSKPKPFNPLDKKNLGESVAKELLEKPVEKLPPAETFIGAGIYALYYIGPFPLYREITYRNVGNKFAWPIYVGKAVPAGARKGDLGLDCDPGKVLHSRLSEHAKSIQQIKNLSLEHFWCRYLVVDDIWIPLAESLLISMHSPLWNIALDGFGNHDPGSGRYEQQCSPWDILHPGRKWAEKLKASQFSLEQIEQKVKDSIDGTLKKLGIPKKSVV
jgi:hypothetical protein